MKNLVNKRATRNDVAKLAGVSVATISYVVNNGPRPVSEETHARVSAAIEKLGYRPHAIARSLKLGNTRTIGLLVPSLLPSLFGHLVTAVEDQLANRDYGLILASSHEDYNRETHMLNVLVDRSIDGLLYIPMSSRLNESIMEIIDRGIPVVFVDRYTPGVPADVVMTDNVGAARQVTNHMIQSGCRKIVCISFSDEASSALDRVEGYRQALRDHNLPVDEKMILLAMWPFGESVASSLLAHIDTYGLPDGIFCTVEGFFSEVIKTLRQIGVRVPDQIQVAGGFTASPSPWQELMDKSIPIVRQNYQSIAQRAVEILINRLSGEISSPRTILVPGELYTS
jgi:LacI family transcriptional regulator